MNQTKPPTLPASCLSAASLAPNSTLQIGRIPQPLKEHPYWCLWRYEQRDSKPTKAPYNPLTGNRAYPNKPGTFAPFTEALAAFQRGGYDGLGIGIFGDIGAIDIDDQFSPITGLSEQAQRIVDMLPSYTELSPSGHGLRIIFHAPGFQYDKARYYINNKKAGLEVYISGCTSKFVTITGNVYRDLPISEQSNQIAAVLEAYMVRPSANQQAVVQRKAPGSCLMDDEVIAKAHTSKGADKFARLWNGDTSGYPSSSDADLALCNLLAFWCGGDMEQMDRLFRQSGLNREKWERGDYRASTLEKAVYDCPAFYKQGSTAAEDFADAVEIVDPTSNRERYRPSDMGNGYLFADSFKSTLRYSPDKIRWMVYDGARWTNAYGDGVARERGKRLSQALWRYVNSYEGEAQKAFTKNAGSLQSVSKREAMLKDAQSVYPLTADKLDANVSLFNCLNGTLDLNTGEFRPHSPDDLLSKVAGVRFDPIARYPLWEKTLAAIFPGKPELSRFMQKWFGYSITGQPKEECLSIMHGATARNGKGTIISTIAAILGDYCVSATPETLEVKQHRDSSKPSEDLARLAGARMVSISEPDKSMHFDAAKVKTLTGRDIITARNLHERSIEYIPQFSITINTNHRPKISDGTLFSSGRIHLIPFERHFAEHEQDKELKDKLRNPQEMSGILNWVLEGLRLYRLEGLAPPDTVRMATAEYQHQSDKIAQFMDECTEPAVQEMVPSMMLYEHYRMWCGRNGVMSEALTSFSLALKAKGYKSERATPPGSKQAMCFFGFKLTI